MRHIDELAFIFYSQTSHVCCPFKGQVRPRISLRTCRYLSSFIIRAKCGRTFLFVSLDIYFFFIL